MIKWIKSNKLPQEPGNLEDLQRRIAFIFVFLTLLAIIVFGISDYLMGLNPFMIKVRVVYVILFSLFMVLMVRYKKYLLSMNLMLGLILVFSLINYHFNDGYKGPTIFNLIVFVVAVSIFFKKPLKLFWLILSIGGYVVVFFLESKGLIVSYQNYLTTEDLFWDNSITIIVSAGFIFVGVSYLITNYQKQHQALADLKKQNEKNLAELSSLNENKNHLIALLSHDLKSPVNSLNTTLELVEEGMLEPEDLQRILFNLKNQSFHLSKVLDNTLGWVLAEMEGYESEIRKVNPWVLGEDMLEMMKIQADKKQQKITLEVNLKSQEANLPVKEIKIVLKNFLDNAIKFSEPGSNIVLSINELPNSIFWEVKNPGKEISDEVQKTLFELRGKSAKGTRREPGTGIGLSLCKKIATKLQWEIGYLHSIKEENIFFIDTPKN